MRISGRARVALAVITALAGCSDAPAPTPAWHDEAGYRWRELSVTRGTAGFTDMAGTSTGITFQNTVSDSALLGNRMLAQGAGIALGDVDGDGRVDVFLARTEGNSALYRNLGGFRFLDATDSAGLAAPGRHATGAAFADTDGDGDLDLLLLTTTGPNALFVNDGRGRFTEHREDAGLVATASGGTTPTLADVDGDGDLDLYVANYKPNSPVDQISPQQRAPNQLVRQVAPGRYEVAPEYQKDFKLVMRPDMGGLNVSMRGATDDFYLNEGGRFVRVPFPSDRFRDAGGQPLTTVEESFGLDARFADLNGDRAPDLYVANDFEDPDLFWLNDGRGGFRLAPWTALRQTSNSGMGVDIGDIDGDGLPDLFETDMLSNDTRRLKTQIPTHTALTKRPGDMETQLQLQRNTLFQNRGDGTFSEIGALAGVSASGWSWGTLLLDVDLDGWQDILIATGHPWDVMDADTQERLQNRLNDISWQRQRWEFPPLPLKNVAFRNRGDRTFEDAGAGWTFGTEADISHALAAADLDGDGDQDVVVGRLRAPTQLLRNNSAAPRIAVRLRGDAPNTQAVGATIRIEGGAIPLQVREVAAGGLYLSHSDYLASFATGTADSVTITVDWRDGRRTTLPGAKPNRLYEISATTAKARTEPPAPTAVQPLFEDATTQLGGHRHSDPAFDDWARQFLLPNALSQLGPGVSWYDVDRDGDEDLIVGTGKGGQIAVFRNDRGRLTPAPAPTEAAAADYTTILGLPGTGGGSLLIGMASWEAMTSQEIASIAPVVSLPLRTSRPAPAVVPLLAPESSSTGPLALADYDGDGDLDLFVGGRAMPGAYPTPASSMLFRNDDGRFVKDPNNAPVLDRIGLVSAALFADIDGDGDADLLLAREWGSILLLLNQGGRYAVAPETWGLNRWTSRWNGLTAGDLDGDGRLDLVATSWGRNVAAQADSARPLIALHGPFGSSGETELLVSRHDSRLNALAPLNGFPRVRTTIPSLMQRVNSFGAYADATVNQVLGADSAIAERLTAVSLDHMVFRNRGGRFDAVPLPAEAQYAPAFAAAVADFDGDGAEDLFLSQNFFPTAIGQPRYDAGRGLLLKGDGKGGLTPLSATAAGIRVLGDQRGAAFSDYDGDGRLDLAVSQNGAATRLLHNRGAAVGLRVRLQGAAGNPDGIGAQIRVIYGDAMGPAREVHAGSGYWSENGAVQVFGLSGTPTAVWVRWPDGIEARVAVPRGALEVVVKR